MLKCFSHYSTILTLPENMTIANAKKKYLNLSSQIEEIEKYISQKRGKFEGIVAMA